MKIKTVRPGIRKKSDGRYTVTKSIKGKRFYKEFRTLTEAVNWKNTFSPLTNPAPSFNPINPLHSSAPSNEQRNGVDCKITFDDLWEKYQENKLKNLGDNTRKTRLRKVDHFTRSLLSVRLCEITPNVIDALIDEKRKLVKDSRRCNFNEEIKFLKAIFNWYAENYDSSYLNPIRIFHKARGKVKDVPDKDLHITTDELERFFEQLPRFWQRLAYLQFYMAGRIQEAAGLQRQYVFFDQRIIKVAEVLIWTDNKPKIKKTTKTSKDSLVYINDHMMEILQELEAERPNNCPFMIQVNGRPVTYMGIYQAYEAALKRANLPYSGTHILRYGMAGVAGDFMGDEGAKAATRHSTMKMAQKYRGQPKTLTLSPDNKAVVIHAETLFHKKKEESHATKCDQEEANEG